MDIKIVLKADYVKQFGDIAPARGLHPETIQLWEKLKEASH